jgi:anti-sigma regulatory factor (Ser/Thr protein kinase)
LNDGTVAVRSPLGMTHQLDLSLLNRATEIARVQNQLEQFAAAHHFPDRKLHEAQLALEEHLTNIFHYAYDDDGEHRIFIGVRLTAADLCIQVQDDGRPFNPLTHPAPDLSVPLAQRPVGGLGIHMIRKSLDGTEYRRENGKNILVMIKRI